VREGVGWSLILFGVMFFALAGYDLYAASQSTPAPQQMTLREFLDGKAGTNRYVAITDFKPCEHFVTRRGRNVRQTSVGYIGILPSGPGPAADPSLPPRLIVHLYVGRDRGELDKERGPQAVLTGVLQNAERDADVDLAKVVEAYPQINLSKCMILNEGFRPPTAGEGWNRLTVGVIATVLGVAFLSPGLAARVGARFKRPVAA
jgi:hypothetical protein